MDNLSTAEIYNQKSQTMLLALEERYHTHQWQLSSSALQTLAKTYAALAHNEVLIAQEKRIHAEV